jgi:hypothetical protein
MAMTLATLDDGARPRYLRTRCLLGPACLETGDKAPEAGHADAQYLPAVRRLPALQFTYEANS